MCYAHKLKLFFPTHTLLKQSRSLGFISINAHHLSISIQGIIWLLSSDFLSITREEEDARKAHAFKQLSAIVTLLGSIHSGHGALWSVSMALTSEDPRTTYHPLPLPRRSLRCLPCEKTHTVKLISGAPLRAIDTSIFSHLSLKAACEGLSALYPHLQRAS